MELFGFKLRNKELIPSIFMGIITVTEDITTRRLRSCIHARYDPSNLPWTGPSLRIGNESGCKYEVKDNFLRIKAKRVLFRIVGLI